MSADYETFGARAAGALRAYANPVEGVAREICEAVLIATLLAEAKRSGIDLSDADPHARLRAAIRAQLEDDSGSLAAGAHLARG